MNRHAASLLCAVALAAASVRPAGSQVMLQQCDRLLTDADAMAQQVVRCAASLAETRAALKAKAATSTAARIQTPEVIRTSTTVYIEISSGTIPEELELAAKAAPLAYQLVSYYSLSAFAADDLGLCAPLTALRMDADCRREAAELLFQRAWQGGTAAEVGAVCGRHVAHFGEQFTADCCAIMAAGKGSNPCSKLVPKCVPDAKACGSFLAPSAGTCREIRLGEGYGCDNAAACEQERDDCLGDAAFAAAVRAKSVALCKGSDRCRALMGDAKSVAQEQAAALMKTPAGRWFVKREWQFPSRKVADVLHPPLQPVRPARTPAAAASGAPGKPATFKGFACEEPLNSLGNRKAVSAAINAVHACLVSVELPLPRMSPAAARDIDAREEKLARMNLRMNAIFDGK